MALVRKWSGDNVGGLDSTFQSLATTIVYDTSGNLQFQGTGTRLAAYSPLGSIATFSMWIRKLNLSAIPTTSAAIVSPLDSGGAQAWRLMVNTAGAIQIRDAANTAGTAYGTAMSTGTDYNIKLEGTTSSITITLYNGTTFAQIGTPVTFNSTFGSVDNFRFGNATGTIAQYTMGAIWFYDTTTAPALPADGAAQYQAKVVIIGDSLTNMAPNATSIFGEGQALLEASLAARGYHGQNVYLWGVGGKRLTVADLTGRTTMSNWADAVSMLGTVDQVIIALGTNDRPQTSATVNTAIDTVLSTIGATVPVTWIGLTSKQFASTDDIRLNGLIAAKLSARGNATFADWDTYIRAIDGGANPSPLWQTADVTHMTHDGYVIRADYYASFLPNLKVAKTSATAWNDRIAATKTSATSWAARMQAIKTSATSWATRHQAIKTAATSWSARAAVLKTSTTSWATRVRIAKTSATSWAARVRVIVTSPTSWNVGGSLVNVVKTSATGWAVRVGIGKTSATIWAVRHAATKTSVTTWHDRARITKVTATIWNDRATVLKTSGTTWAAHHLIVLTIAVLWAVRQRVTHTSVTTWNVAADSHPLVGAVLTGRLRPRNKTGALAPRRWSGRL